MDSKTSKRKLKRIEVTIKNSWDSVTVQDYIDLESCENDFQIVQLFMPDYNLDVITLESYQELLKSIQFVTAMPQPKRCDYVAINGTIYTNTANIHRLTTSQFIDLNHYLKDTKTNTKAIISCLLVPDRKKYGEDYTNDVDAIASMLPIEIGLGLITEITETIEQLKNTFAGLFGGQREETEEGEDDDQPTSDYLSRWGWIDYASRIAKDICNVRIEEVFKMQILEFMNYCSMIKERGDFDAERIQKYKQQ